ncbi:hypothetical protein [Xanthomonas phage XPP1]|uniref:Uncharacterized protein n=2 Tax=Tsukubavirus TaxID=2948935 RepID=A0A3S7I691_9CAUD|nr:hypothetical protein KEM11_gp48 [Xanthomonas phage XPP1]YP_010052486.1 hypothetical protein KEM12_gp05 [Xanthomonas phage XPV1]AVO23745.1 hypothetical protein [Xanthomonas phage XPP2]AVO23822.1 hypothetical protein [Xanthomonas phage XPP3]AVO23912.1 hypothetical protein [Xanthomonas phage XPP4]AVO23949.1 hypothetical protein [Xanthomonas phage XPP6]AVO24074.1 hypothetical protein [Xanthomonas phage XPP8]AVO24130.1 hypothetical protein [Xanthomonas phage XPP9]AVO24305.1 hypothetical prote
MKPNWLDAPEWANFLAMDTDGAWVWYEKHPRYVVSSGRWTSAGREDLARNYPPRALDTLETRP